jgi:hypothetical protein
MANLINKMLKAELVKYIVDATVGTEQEEFACDLTAMLKKELVVKAERIYADTLQHEETLGEEDLGDDRHSALEEPVNEADAEEAKYFHMHYQANFDKKLDDGTKTHVDFGCVVTFRLLDDGKWLCDKTSTKNLGWMLDPKFSYKGKWQKGVEREVIGCRTRSIHELKEWLTNGRYGQTVSQYLSQSEMPDYNKCEVGKPIAKGVLEDVQVTSDPVLF